MNKIEAEVRNQIIVEIKYIMIECVQCEWQIIKLCLESHSRLDITFFYHA